MTFKVVYDFADEWPRLYPFLFFVASLLCMIYCRRVIKKYRKGNVRFSMLFNDRPFVGSVLAGCLFLFMGYLLLNPLDYMNAKAVYKNTAFKQTLGYVSHFKDKTYSKCRIADFTVNGLNFDFPDNGALYGCQYKPISRSGIKDSSFIQIYYFTNNGTNRVLRLEIFKY